MEFLEFLGTFKFNVRITSIRLTCMYVCPYRLLYVCMHACMRMRVCVYGRRGSRVIMWGGGVGEGMVGGEGMVYASYRGSPFPNKE